ncbi:hypothetical protein OXYTRIMIC_470 [Oxytricha trifallax]|uniref:MT-A70 family protein n=1 Tax=Oxytricha trifallax TaxID=1172189 RepID=A0A073IBY2_9SPIT|nr:hypothetical protein OXYTRIMIC_470 [Oxytricha trifallax]
MPKNIKAKKLIKCEQYICNQCESPINHESLNSFEVHQSNYHREVHKVARYMIKLKERKFSIVEKYRGEHTIVKDMKLYTNLKMTKLKQQQKKREDSSDQNSRKAQQKQKRRLQMGTSLQQFSKTSIKLNIKQQLSLSYSREKQMIKKYGSQLQMTLWQDKFYEAVLMDPAYRIKQGVLYDDEILKKPIELVQERGILIMWFVNQKKEVLRQFLKDHGYYEVEKGEQIILKKK